MSTPLLPRYGASALSDLVPSIGAHLGLDGLSDVVGLPAADRYVLLLVDGLGEGLLADAAAHAPHLSAARAGTLTSVTPSTTATALSSLGTGLTPGEHGMAGFSFRHPFANRVLNALAWERGLSGLDVQPRYTALERIARDGVVVTTALPARFADTGLTQAALRGGRFAGVTDESDTHGRIEQIVEAASAGPRTLVYAYERALDHTAHREGWGSLETRAVLEEVDAFAARLRADLPDDVRLVVTGDHGGIDVDPSDRLVIEDEPDLHADLTLVGGEGRFRQLYTPDPAAVASRWRDRLGERAWVRTRDEATDEGWFGPLAAGLAPRFGDVVVAMRGTGAVLTRTFPGEFRLVGMHGSLTPDEMLVPLITE